jgi:hypothetical protein
MSEAPKVQPVEAPKRDAEPLLIDWLAGLCHTRDLVHVDPLVAFGGRIKAPPRARCNTRVFPMCWEGSAAGFQYALDAGFRARLSIADVIGTRSQALAGLRPHARRAEDKQQGVTPLDHDLDQVLINSVALMEPYNGLTQSVGIVTSTLPAVYGDLKRRQTEDLAAELGVNVINPDVVAHIPVGDRPDPKPIPVLKVGSAAAAAG